MKTETLKQALTEWRDVDSAMLALAISLGLMTPETAYHKVKPVFWSNNPTGTLLNGFLASLVELGALDYRDTEGDDEYRWNPSFRGSWEGKNEVSID